MIRDFGPNLELINYVNSDKELFYLMNKNLNTVIKYGADNKERESFESVENKGLVKKTEEKDKEW